MKEPNDKKTASLRAIPSVNELVESAEDCEWASQVPRSGLVDAARAVLEEYRACLINQDGAAQTLSIQTLVEQVQTRAQIEEMPKLKPLINATGIILHTGLGRAPLASSAHAAMSEAAEQYANVELDLPSGQRNQRVDVVRDLLCKLTGAESATVVNNNAAATLLVLAAVAGEQGRGTEVIVSRGELIEIGGSFRLPDIMAASTAMLREVGTTNKTRLSDYENAIGSETAALLKIHTSNYRVVGFTAAVSIQQLVTLGSQHALPVVHDIGSGAMIDFTEFGLSHEPMASDSIAAGADMVLFSGDKLLGGPQAGIVVGKAPWITKLSRHPMARALRIDKLTLAALEATLRLYRDPARLQHDLPVLSMASAGVDELRGRAQNIISQIGSTGGSLDITIHLSTAYLGGGSMPAQGMKSLAIRLAAEHLSEATLAQQLRTGDPPVVPRVQDGAVWLDLRTVLPRQDEALVKAIGAVTG